MENLVAARAPHYYMRIIYKFWIPAVVFAALLVAGVAVLCFSVFCRDPVFPGTEWTWKTPEAAGFSSEKLDKFVERVRGSGCIVHKGEMIRAWGDYTRRQDVASAAKPFYTHFTIKALENGLINSLDEPVVEWASELADINAALGYKDREITWRHLLTQTSGYSLIERPGETFAYNDYQTGLLLWILVRRVYECGYDGADKALLGELLDNYLYFEDKPTMRRSTSRNGRIRISPRDLARFGYLYLMNGRWMDEKLISRKHVKLILNSPIPRDMPRTSGEDAERVPNIPTIGGGNDGKHHLGAHSFFWWLNSAKDKNQRLFPAAPPGTFATLGHGGSYAMIVIPEYELIVVWLRGFPGKILTPLDGTGRYLIDEALQLLLEARVKES